MGRGRLSAGERVEAWGRWRRGDTQDVIAAALSVSRPAIGKMLRRAGGFGPRVRGRAARVLQTAEREEISRGLATGLPLRAVARQLGRAPSTITREVARHGGRVGYRAGMADARAWARARRPKRCRAAFASAAARRGEAGASVGP